MNIAILSGKGGTGKTTVSTNLAIALKSNYYDCDVEEPNGFIFLNPVVNKTVKVEVDNPYVDKDKCIACGACVKVCQFNALAKVNNEIMLFEKLCHSCGACKLACKYEALDYKKREIGIVEYGMKEDMLCCRGLLNIGEPMAVPIIKQMLTNINKDKINIIDCPPGTSCNVVNVIKKVDYAILVTEPSEFGLHDLKMAVNLLRLFKIPFVVVINKDDDKQNIIREYCTNEQIHILGAIPYSQQIAIIYSKGGMLYDDFEFKKIFDNMANGIKEMLKWI